MCHTGKAKTKRKLDATKEDQPSEKKPSMAVEKGVAEDKARVERSEFFASKEEKKLAEMMIPKKRKRLYEKIVYGQKRKSKEVFLICEITIF